MIHKKFAYIYDEFMDNVDYNSWFKFIKSYLPKKGIKNVADLGSGTGKMSYLFAKAGYDVDAYDISDDMLEISKSKYNMDNLKFYKLDIVNDRIDRKYGLIMCNFDTVNYFSSLSDLKKFLSNVYNSLEDDGYFIFDFVEVEIFDEIFENDIFIDETENYTHIMRHEQLSKYKHLVEMTIFLKEDDIYRKYVEKHEKNIFETEKLLETVREQGFEIYDTARNSEYGESRVFLVCRKKK